MARSGISIKATAKMLTHETEKNLKLGVANGHGLPWGGEQNDRIDRGLYKTGRVLEDQITPQEMLIMLNKRKRKGHAK